MPALALPAFWGAVGAGVYGGAQIYSARTGARSARRAGDITERTTTEALDWEREQEARRRAEYEQERARAWALEDEDRTLRNEDRLFNRGEYLKREGRLAPYREYGAEGLANIRSLMRPNAAARPLAVPPPVVPPGRAVMLPQPRVPAVAAAAIPSRYQNFADLIRPPRV